MLRHTLFQVEGFWGSYCHLSRASTLPNPTDLHLFKEGIRPLWEVSAWTFLPAAITVVTCYEGVTIYLSHALTVEALD